MKSGAKSLTLHFFVKEILLQKKCTFSWDPCIEFARTYEKNPAEETFMDIFHRQYLEELDTYKKSNIISQQRIAFFNAS